MAKNEKIPYFCRVVLQNFPFIEEDFDALTTYQLISKVVEYLNKVIKSQNTLVDNVNNLSLAFQQLHDYVENYFANLDVQEEINNKLDDMAEAGTLQEIITAYIQANVAWCFDTVADMKSSTNLVNGSYAQTLGFHSIGDGGAGIYKITNTGTANEMNVIAIGSLYATLLVNEKVVVEQFGAYGDNTHDDQDAINQALKSDAGTINFMPGKTYLIKGYETGQRQGGTPADLTDNTGLVVPSDKIVDLNGAKIKIITNDRTNYNGFTIASVSNVTIKNGKIEGDRKTHTGSGGEWGYGISIRYAHNVILENLIITEMWADGINISNDGDPSTLCTNITIRECICDGNRRQGMSVENGDGFLIENSEFINTGNDSYQKNPSAGIDIEPFMNSGNMVKNIRITNCNLSNNYSAGVISSGNHTDGAMVDGLLVDHCIIKGNQYGSSLNGTILVLQSLNVVFDSNEIEYNDASIPQIILRPSNELIFKNNKVKNPNITVRSDYLNNSYITFEGNYFYYLRNLQYNGCIEAVAFTTTNDNNQLFIRNNIFEASTNSTNILGYVIDSINSKFNKATIEGNTFKYGRRGFSGNASFVVKDNNFIAQYEYTGVLSTGNENQLTIIDSNLFEASGFNNSGAGLVLNSSKLGMIAQNNNYIDTIIEGDTITVAHTPARITEYTDITGIDISVNNNFSSVTE